jgi:hypothetical protein
MAIKNGAYQAEEKCVDRKPFIMVVENTQRKKKKIGTNGIRSEKKVCSLNRSEKKLF